MNVRLATQVLSGTTSQALTTFGPSEAAATALYCDYLDKFFDCLNVKNCNEYVFKRKLMLKPYTSLDDERFEWLLKTFLQYFKEWKESIKNRPGDFTASEQPKMFISWQTFESLQITCHSTVELIKYLLSNNVKYVLSERFSQDPLENYFGRQRSMGSRRDNPNARVFGYQDNTIRNLKSFKPIRESQS